MRDPSIRRLLLAAVVTLLTGAWWWRRRTPGFALAADGNQNVLLVTIDTLRAGALSSYGGPERRTSIGSPAMARGSHSRTRTP